jgi:hypothetical protein
LQDGKGGNKHSGVRTIGSQPSQETFKVECEILLTEYTDSNLKVEAEYVSEGTMRDEWGWSEILCQFSLLAEMSIFVLAVTRIIMVPGFSRVFSLPSS